MTTGGANSGENFFPRLPSRPNSAMALILVSTLCARRLPSRALLFFEEPPMGMEGVRTAFLHAAAGRLRLDHAGLTYRDDAQVLALTGWHADGTPFALVTAPFCGDVQLRARQPARRQHRSKPQTERSPCRKREAASPA